jgi:hypothetical protein
MKRYAAACKRRLSSCQFVCNKPPCAAARQIASRHAGRSNQAHRTRVQQSVLRSVPPLLLPSCATRVSLRGAGWICSARKGAGARGAEARGFTGTPTNADVATGVLSMCVCVTGSHKPPTGCQTARRTQRPPWAPPAQCTSGRAGARLVAGKGLGRAGLCRRQLATRQTRCCAATWPQCRAGPSVRVRRRRLLVPRGRRGGAGPSGPSRAACGDRRARKAPGSRLAFRHSAGCCLGGDPEDELPRLAPPLLTLHPSTLPTPQ